MVDATKNASVCYNEAESEWDTNTGMYLTTAIYLFIIIIIFFEK